MNTENWATYNLNTIFNIEYGSKLDIIKMEENPYSDIAFVTRTATNNGITMFVNEYTGKKPYSAGIMTIALGGSIGKTFIQPTRFYTCQNVAVLIPKTNLSIYHKIFLKTIIEKECETRFVAFGRELNSHIKNDFFIKLPANNGQPDWQWMEDYAKNTLLPQLPMKTRQVWEKKYNNQPLSAQKLELKVEEWKWFDYYGKNGLFDITGSTTTPKDILEESGNGTHPYVTTQAVNNGIEGYYNIATEEGSVFTVDSAVLGFCAYQEKDFSASDHVEKLIPKFSCNKYIALFLTTIINREQYRYNYGRKASQTKLRQSKIKLPAVTNEQGETVPDWQWMEDYIKGLPYSGCLEQN